MTEKQTAETTGTEGHGSGNHYVGEHDVGKTEALPNSAYSACRLCPRNCSVNRTLRPGVCGATDRIKIGRAALHFWEEPCISGENGSGTVFFSGCNLGCVFCQNAELSQRMAGTEISTDKLADIFLRLESEGANNINLVTGTHFVPDIVRAAEAAKNKGLSIPFLWNSGGYEKTETLSLLDGLIDIYLPDLKYLDAGLAGTLSKAPDYPETACAAIREMVRQTGAPEFFENGIIKKGTIVRHLVLPGHVKEAKKVVSYLYETYGDNIFISIMSQFTPLCPEVLSSYGLERKLTKREYERVVDYALELGVTNAFIQEGETAKESFIPDFNAAIF